MISSISEINEVKKQGTLATLFNKKYSLLQYSLFSGGVYLAVLEPYLVVVTAIGVGLDFIFKDRLKFWQLAGIVVGVMMFFITNQPAHALFLDNVQTFVTTLATSSQSIDSSSVALVFNLIRAIFLIVVVVAALFAYNQAQQGNDWRPIATQAALAIGILLAIDVITFLFVGGQGTTGGTT